jgi:molybdopterin-guanine dinucleotide biosynthesis protein A
MQDTDLNNITLAILAGGAGSRMGLPKAFLQLSSRPILHCLRERFDWPGPSMLVLAPGIETPPGAEEFDQVVSDPVAGAGPLRGVLTTLESAATQIVVVATVDMPQIAHEHLEWLAQRLTGNPQLSGIMCHRPQVGIEPFPSVYRSSARLAIAEQLAHQRRSVRGLLKIEGFATSSVPDDWPSEIWANLNTPQDLARFNRKPASG